MIAFVLFSDDTVKHEYEEQAKKTSLICKKVSKTVMSKAIIHRRLRTH
jgi:hypothetical protein